MTPLEQEQFIGGYWFLSMIGLVIHHIWYYIQLKRK